MGEPLEIPGDAGPDEMERLGGVLRARMLALEAKADETARGPS